MRNGEPSNHEAISVATPFQEASSRPAPALIAVDEKSTSAPTSPADDDPDMSIAAARPSTATMPAAASQDRADAGRSSSELMTSSANPSRTGTRAFASRLTRSPVLFQLTGKLRVALLASLDLFLIGSLESPVSEEVEGKQIGVDACL